jgi:hypothetical protein
MRGVGGGDCEWTVDSIRFPFADGRPDNGHHHYALWRGGASRSNASVAQEMSETPPPTPFMADALLLLRIGFCSMHPGANTPSCACMGAIKGLPIMNPHRAQWATN